MNRKYFCLSLMSLALIGCSTVSKKQANGDFEYANNSQQQPLVIPSSLSKPAEKNLYYVATDFNQEGPVGANVDVRAPTLVLPVATSTRVEQDTSAAKVWFDQVLDQRSLIDFVKDAVIERLKAHETTMSKISEDENRYWSGWAKEIEDGNRWLVVDEDFAEQAQFSFLFEVKPHGRSVALTVDLTGYERQSEEGVVTDIDAIDKQRLEMIMLNEIIGQVDYRYRELKRDNRLMKANQKIVSIDQTDSGEAALLVEMELEQLWSNMTNFFADNGFTVNDLNESTKVYYVDYVEPSNSLWDRVWGDAKPVIEIPEAKYQFELIKKADESTLVVIKDEQGNALDRATLDNIFPVIEPLLSFRDTF